jgi:hypothetical protein
MWSANIDRDVELTNFVERTCADVLNLTDRQYTSLPAGMTAEIAEYLGEIDALIDIYLARVELNDLTAD